MSATPFASARKPAPSNPASLPSARSADRELASGFERFGQWGEKVSVVRDGAIHSMANWLATHPDRKTTETDELWRQCREANRPAFRDYHIVRLDAPSYFLPQGEVVFTVTENPSQLPDNPPQGVTMRHLEAMTAHPLAKFYLLEPVFTTEPYLRLYTADELREEARGDQRVSQQIARHFGWAHRTAKWSRQRAVAVAGVALRAAAWTIEMLTREVAWGRRQVQFHGRSHDELTTLLAGDTLVELARRADDNGLDYDARRLRRAVQELRWRMSVDPVLCFELPERPGELWFEAHWFTGADGRRYVHY